MRQTGIINTFLRSRGGTLGGEEEGGAVTFTFDQENESFITIIVCLVGILLSLLNTALWRKYSQNKCSKFQKPHVFSVIEVS